MAVDVIVMIIRWSIVILVKIFGFIRHDEEQRASLHTKQVWKKKKQREELRDLAKKERKTIRNLQETHSTLGTLNGWY